ncbi:TetR/AcrR family transcriptional regulator [Amycolatopsis sp. NPDC059027]|uniref:TetR/AcrR family transcriptional regulator n=1 Tax=unclassified Amycolatopsis TaxID=2618356 RepID=UPI00366C3FAA
MRGPGRSDEILAVFTRNVARYGYDGTNFSEIAAELGISKGTIVHHYGTKDRLLAALHESYMRRRLAEAELLVERLGSPAERLAGLLYAFMLYQVHDRDATVAFQREIVRLADQPALAGGVRLRAEYLDLVRGVIESGVDSGKFRRSNLNVQSLLVFGSAQWAWTWFDPDGPQSAEEVGAALVDLVLGSLLVRRSGLASLADPAGDVVRIVRKCLLAAEAA